MKIEQINIHKVTLPFSSDFSHSRSKEWYALNIVVEIVADQGKIKGYGEGAPRVYVTGESQESVPKSISNFLVTDSFPWELNDASQIWEFLDRLPDGGKHNSAICALEMSLLDALGRAERRSIGEYFPRDFYTDKIHYGAVIPLSNMERITEICELIRKMGIKKLRLKMGQDIKQNTLVMKEVKRILGDEHELRIDVNGAWDRELAFRHISLIEDFKVKVVEQPMMPDDPDIAEFARTIKGYNVILMADESACSLRDIERIGKQGHYEMVNVRLSKCGGFRNALRIIDQLRQRGISFQIGCHLGESGLLSAAGRALGLLCRDALYYDGSYDQFLLKENITLGDVSFGSQGEAGPLNSPGLGIEVSRQSLLRLTTASTTITA